MTSFDLFSPMPNSRLLRSGEATAVADCLRERGLAVLPTETGYLLAALVTSIPAVERAFTVKRRSRANPMHIACSSVEMAAQYGRLTPEAVRLLGCFTPGPLSVVVEQTDRLPTGYVTLNGTVGIRIPDHPATLQVIAALGAPVTATSLNRSGEETAPISRGLLESLDWKIERVPVVADDGTIRYRSPSTLVRVTGPEVEILRAGPVDASAVRQVLGRDGVDRRPTPREDAASARS
jgi:L-threonylcarbamoyladenylate synthase